MVWVLAPTIDPNQWPELLLFSMMIALAAMFPIPHARGGYITTAGILLYALIARHQPGAALVVVWFSYAIGFAISRAWVPWKIISTGARLGISVVLASYVFRLLGGDAAQSTIRSLVIPLVGAVLVQEASNSLLVAFYFSQVRRTPLLATWLQDMKDLTFSNLLSVPTAALLVILSASISPLVLLLYLVALPLQRRVHQLLSQKTRIYAQAIDSLVLAIDANFPQGRGHSRRVADLAVAIAREMRLSDSATDSIELAALIHDVGLIGLDEVGQDTLTEQDVARLHDHPNLGAAMMRELPNRSVVRIVKHHHERFDGTGYPDGLRGRRIPIGARIVGVAEVFDSLRAGGLADGQALSPTEALHRIASEAGNAFDPRVVEAFRVVWEQGMPAGQNVELGEVGQPAHVRESAT
jgi:HD-GYP domain-containing protein (c-di-GMP phosphodiesterase class II)